MWRWALWGAGGIVGVLAIAVGTGIALLRSLESPWEKSRIQRLARSSAGVDVDYRKARVDLLEGLAIDDLVVRTPGEFRAVVPDLLRVGHVEVRWSLKGLLGRGGATIERASIADLTVAVVVDPSGRTSLDALSSSSPPAAPAPATPLSRLTAKFLSTPPAVGSIAIDRLNAIVVRIDRGREIDRTELRGLAAALVTSPATAPEPRGWKARLTLGSPEAPLDLDLTRTQAGAPAGDARAKLALSIDATPSRLDASFDLRMVQQSFAATVAADHWLHAEAKAAFDPNAGRTTLTIERVEAGDQAVTARASVEIPDAGDAIVHRAEADVDVARLLAWVPSGLVPVAVDSAHLHGEAESLVIGSTVRMLEGGSASVDLQTSGLQARTAGGPARADAAVLSIRARPASGNAITGRASIELTHAQVPSIQLEILHAELNADRLSLDADHPLATRGDVSLSAEVGSLDIRSPSGRALVDGLTLRARAALEGHAPYALDADATFARLRYSGQHGERFVDASGRFECGLRDVEPDLARPVASRGAVHATLALGDVQSSVDLDKRADSADFTVRVAAQTLTLLRSFVPPRWAAAVPLERVAASIRSTGRATHLGDAEPSLVETTEMTFDHPAFETTRAASLALVVKTRGSAVRPQVDLDLRAAGLSVDGGAPSDEHVTLAASADRARPSLQFKLGSEGRATTHLGGTFSFDAARRAVVYEAEGQLAHLAPLAPLAAKVKGLEAFDLSELEVALSARGSVFGVVARVDRDGTVVLEPDPARTAVVEGTSDLHVTHFRWNRGDDAVIVPDLVWHATTHGPEGRRTFESDVEAGTVHLDLGNEDVDVNGIHDDATAVVTGDLLDPEIDLTQHLSVRAVEQTIVHEYPIGDLDLALTAERMPEGVVHVTGLKIDNRAGGTAFGMTGNVYLGEGRHALSITTSLTQDLATLSGIAERFEGRGRVAVEANVTSPDFEHYHVRSMVKGEDVAVKLRRAGVDVEAANGEVPITVSLTVGENGVSLERSEKRSPYSMLRFADQHPLLSRSGFLSIGSIKTPFAAIDSLVGNLEIEQNVVSLRQFEMGVRGGRITGQCGVDWDGPKSTLELHVRASGVQSSHGEPFDGNIAVAFAAADRTIDGRAEILRIGTRHLLDLLDLQDPSHTDAAMNRVRSALAFGYPKHLRLVFDHGFASMHIDLGGLAQFVSIGEIRGIPMGPIVDKMLASMLDGRDTKETQ